jgi:hypothetical protein
MNSFEIWSDHSFTWSATHAEEIIRRPAKAPSGSARQAAATRWHPSWFSHRTLQALWQAWLQMRQGPRSWPQILLVCELPECAAASGLCSAEPSCGDQEIPRPLSTRSRNLGADLRDQPRVTAPPRGALSAHDEHRFFLAHRAHRSPISKHDRRQYARELVGLSPQHFDNCGGHR